MEKNKGTLYFLSGSCIVTPSGKWKVRWLLQVVSGKFSVWVFDLHLKEWGSSRKKVENGEKFKVLWSLQCLSREYFILFMTSGSVVVLPFPLPSPCKALVFDVVSWTCIVTCGSPRGFLITGHVYKIKMSASRRMFLVRVFTALSEFQRILTWKNLSQFFRKWTHPNGICTFVWFKEKVWDVWKGAA